MKESRWCLLDGISGWIAAIAMLCAMTLTVAACSTGGETTEFPIGRFVREGRESYVFVFNEDRTFMYYEDDILWVEGTYSIDGDHYTEETHNTNDPKVPATYTWTYDGQKLKFTNLVGKDVIPHRKGVYNRSTWIKVDE